VSCQQPWPAPGNSASCSPESPRSSAGNPATAGSPALAGARCAILGIPLDEGNAVRDGAINNHRDQSLSRSILLGVLRGVATPEQRQPAEHPDHEQIEEAEAHE